MSPGRVHSIKVLQSRGWSGFEKRPPTIPVQEILIGVSLLGYVGVNLIITYRRIDEPDLASLPRHAISKQSAMLKKRAE